jgi:hypothetical protein
VTVDVRTIELPEPLLEFGSGELNTDPKRGLQDSGPFSLRYKSQPTVRLGIVGPEDAVTAALRWFERTQSRLPTLMKNRQRYPDWPGFERVFQTPLELDQRWVRPIPSIELQRALLETGRSRFDRILQLYTEGVGLLAEREQGPNVVVCAVSDEILEAAATLDQTGQRIGPRRPVDPRQLALSFDFATEQSGDEPLYRTLRRALKARVMLLPRHLPTQLVTSHLFRDDAGGDDAAARAWSVSVGVYYKSRGVPWRLAHVAPHVCFVGISFHRMTSQTRDVTYASLAQAFSTEIEGFVLRGSEPVLPREDRRIQLTRDQAFGLGNQILQEYRNHAERLPVRVTLHKTTLFSRDEREGFDAALKDVPVVEMLTLSASNYRLLTPWTYPPKRGTLFTINGETNLLYTTGLYRPWETYPGPHIPAPIEVVAPTLSRDDIRRVSEETLGLTKMNWNSASVGGRDPITLRMAYEVGPIMAELPASAVPERSYRYYM